MSRRMAGARRVAVFLLAVAVVAFIGLSVLDVAEHAQHDCAGSHCPVCAQLQATLDLMRSFGVIVVVLLLFLGALSLAFHNISVCYSTQILVDTPVLLHVRLNN